MEPGPSPQVNAFPPKEGALTDVQQACPLSEPFSAEERSPAAGASLKVIPGKMDINRNAWKAECVFSCGRFQVGPYIIDFLKIVLQTTLHLEMGGRYALPLDNI